MEPFVDVIGRSPALAAVRDKLSRILQHGRRRLPPVLILGETGTGKGLLARALHRGSSRSDGPFVPVNCAAIPENLLESEIFGYERGAFTDARQAKPGLFHAARNGTLFLDEVGTLSPLLQAKLLTAIEDRQVRRLGSTKTEPIDVWILAATSEDLPAAIRERRFREELFHRLSAMTVTLPPLRERGADIVTLADHFLAQFCRDYERPMKRLAADAQRVLLQYGWPGNVRELANAMERVVVLSEETVVTAALLGVSSLPGGAPATAAADESGPSPRLRFRAALSDFERSQVLAALESEGWNLSRAAVRLGLPRNTLRYRLEKLGVQSGRGAPIGRELDGPPAPSPSDLVHSPPEPEGSPAGIRRSITLLHLVVDSPDDDEGRRQVGEALDVSMDKVRSFGGRIEELGGNSFVAAFGFEPMEDATVRAVYAAFAIRKAAERLGPTHAVPFTIRTALLHVTACALVEGHERLVIERDERHRALAELLSLLRVAGPGTIVCSIETGRLLARRFVVHDVAQGERSTSHAEIRSQEPTGLGIGGRPLSPFVHRNRELTALLDLLRQAQAGHGQVVGLTGDAGAGKSRLVYEFRNRLDHREVTYLEGHCASFGTSVPYFPIAALLRATFNLGDSDDPDTTVARVIAGLTALELPSDDSTYVLQILGVASAAERAAALSPEATRDRTFAVLRHLWLRVARQRPLVIAIEDVHWCDATSLAVIASLVESLAPARLLVLVTYRPGGELPWLNRSYATQLALTPLTTEASMEVIRSVLGPEAVTGDIADLIVPRAAGNPFFVEELAWALRSQASPPRPRGIPDNIHDVLLARIDQLPRGASRLLQDASVIGPKVPLYLLRAISPDGAGHLRLLSQRELLIDDPDAAEATCQFKHALIQEVAYEGLHGSRRRQLHAAVARTLTVRYAGRLSEVEDHLAYHYSQAEEADEAIRYLISVAEKRVRAHAHLEAVAALGRARTLAGSLEPGRHRDEALLQLVIREVASLHQLGRYQDGLNLLSAHADIAARVQDPVVAARFSFWVGNNRSIQGDIAVGAAMLSRAIELAERCGDQSTLGMAHYALGFEQSRKGEPVEALAHVSSALPALGQPEDRLWRGMSYWLQAGCHLFLGQVSEAEAAEERLCELADELGDPRLQSYSARILGWIASVRGDWTEGIEACEKGLDATKDPVSATLIVGQLGCLYLDAMEPDRAIPLLQQAVDQARDVFPDSGIGARFLAPLSEAYLGKGDVPEAERLALVSLEGARASGFWFAVTLASRALGRVRKAQGRFAEARSHLLAALDLASAKQAAFERGLTLVALAELALAEGEAPHASARLREACDVLAALGLPKQVERVQRLIGAGAP